MNTCLGLTQLSLGTVCASTPWFSWLRVKYVITAEFAVSMKVLLGKPVMTLLASVYGMRLDDSIELSIL